MGCKVRASAAPQWFDASWSSPQSYVRAQLTGGINLPGARGARPLVRDLHTPCGQAHHITPDSGLWGPPAPKQQPGTGNQSQ